MLNGPEKEKYGDTADTYTDDGANLPKDILLILRIKTLQNVRHLCRFKKVSCKTTTPVNSVFGTVSSSDLHDSELKPQDFFKYCSVLLFVIDAPDSSYTESLNYFLKMIEMNDKINKKIKS